jgi:hypothetical protein
MAELHYMLRRATLVYYDNINVVCISFNPMQHQLLTVQNRVEVHRKHTSDLVPFSPRRVPKVCQSKDRKLTAKVLYFV